jgi:hypothetical protein
MYAMLCYSVISTTFDENSLKWIVISYQAYLNQPRDKNHASMEALGEDMWSQWLEKFIEDAVSNGKEIFLKFSSIKVWIWG